MRNPLSTQRAHWAWLIKLGNFQRTLNKFGDAYALTLLCVKEKILMTKKFLAAKEEYESPSYEIEKLKKELDTHDPRATFES